MLLGAISFTEARQSPELIQIIEANGMTAAIDDDELLAVKDAEEMNWQMDKFSRTFDIENYKKAMEMAGELKQKPPRVHTWELIDKAFSFPRVRRFDDVQENMNMLEHFQDNLNTNMSNQKHVENFIRVGKTVM